VGGESASLTVPAVLQVKVWVVSQLPSLSLLFCRSHLSSFQSFTCSPSVMSCMFV